MVMQRIPRRSGFVEPDDPARLTLEDQLMIQRAPKLPPGDRRRVDWKDIAGKVSASPNTALGLGLGAVGYGLGQLNRLRPGDQPDPRVQIGHNAVEFIHNPLMFGALTLGNTTNYAGDPYDANDRFWYGEGRPPMDGDKIQRHEGTHTYQSQQLGPAYLVSNMLGGAAGLLFDRDKEGRPDWHGPHNWNERGPQMNLPRPWPLRGAK